MSAKTDHCPKRAAAANADHDGWERSPLTVACPACGVRRGQPCIPEVDRHEEPTCVRCKTPIFMPEHVAVVIGEGTVHSRCPVVIEA
jgi:hypothetical protein